MFLKRPYTALLFVVIVLSSACSAKFARLQKKGTTEEKYKAANQYYKKGDYYKAGLLFEEIIPLLKGDSLAEQAQFFNAYSQYQQKQYSMSSYLFKSFYSTYANSPLAEEAFYMYAFSMYKDSPNFNLDQTNTLTAIDALQTFINSFPGSKYAESANQNLIDLRHRLEEKAYEKAKLYYKTSGVTIANFKAAVVAIDNFQRDFPDSEYNEELAFLKVQSQYELAVVSFENKQKERFLDVLKFYEEFIDAYPKSKYMKQAQKAYDGANKELERIAKIEQEIKELKAKQAAEAQKAETAKKG
ncbi:MULTISPECIES: outer membrane protein assembly factor BamD [Emticicia]|uniref:outer membrane protein assembly factor BamD n=1 Tax=Emticicia TaxID=312278 RepID=UPI000C78A371|nr:MULTISPECIES: outer membrane protein assembly factor BamD [Emticicia]PLK43407.1 outer membrane protein assembly factor BamD [Emticicia sp. TH156]UTA68858.1 outer membrane protein assembly factor BamD [Emticicia sp. 21SJ11W-3]